MKLPFDEIYCLCFAEDQDRINNVNNVLSSSNLSEIVKIRYTVKYPYDLSIIKYLKEIGCYYWNGKGNGGAFGCTIEHYSMVKQAYVRGLSNILVMEDDIIIDSTCELLEMFNSAPKDYDIIRYAFVVDKQYKNENKEYIQLNDNVWGTCCYALSRNGMKYYIEYMDKHYGVADLPFCDINEINNYSLKCYFYSGYEIRDGNLKSNIQLNFTNYNIPKIIHYCWLSDSEISNEYKQYMDTWSILNGYEFNKLDKNTFDINSCNFVKTAYDKGAYAFASDYIRLWALYNYGGIYLDCDVSIVKNFNDLLNQPYMLCIENERWDNLEAGIMGFAPKNPIVKYILDWYDNQEFTEDIEVLPVIMKRLILNGLNKKITKISNQNDWDYSENVINVYTKDYFSPKGIYDGIIRKTENTYTIHNFNAGWVDNFGNKKRVGPTPINTLHTAWLGEGKIEDDYFESQEKHINNFSRVIWTENNFINHSCRYYDYMMETKQYKFASDYVRFKVLYEFGGLYMDTDVECIKDFPKEIFNTTFFATEKVTNRVATGLIMYFKKPRSPILRYVLDIYENYSEDKPLIDGEILADSLQHYGKYEHIDKTQKVKDVIVYDSTYFCPKNLKTKEIDIKENTLTIHWYDETVYMKAFGDGMRLGNVLYCAFSLYSYACSNNKKPVLDNYFTKFSPEIKRIPFIKNMLGNVIECKNRYDFKFTDGCEIPKYKGDVTLCGYMQDYRFFQKNLEDIKRLMKPSENIINDIHNRYGDLSEYVCVLIRKGDYINYKETYTQPDVSWYIDVSNKHFKNRKIFIQSDDIELCKAELSNFDSDIKFADSDADVLTDFYVQTVCYANVCSCSTFSLIGAILNDNKRMIVPYPFWGIDKKSYNENLIPYWAIREKV